MLKTRFTNGARSQIRTTASKTRVTAEMMSAGGFGGDYGSVPISAASFGTPLQTTMLQGLLPDTSDSALIPYLRDLYYYDSIGGSVVDLFSSFPFSDHVLVGLENKELDIFNESMSRLNTRSLMNEASTCYLVDGAFIGSLVYDRESKSFHDILVHDTISANVSLQPLHVTDPSIIVNSSGPLNNFLNHNNPYIELMLSGISKSFIQQYTQGPVALDPISTIYIPRRGMQDRMFCSYLKRLLPVYLFEKVMYRGTLIEAHKRQRATSHITAGTDNWIPTDAELEGLLERFVASEADPLGAWIVTREGVQVNDVRQGGDFWKFTDTIDALVPMKLRSLGVSEAFLSGEASFATAETAVSVFLDSSDAYRQYMTYKMFTSKIHPIIAVNHGLYKDPSRALRNDTARNLMMNLGNLSNLKLPSVQWTKSLAGKDSESQWDMLDKLSEKGFIVPLKMWAAAAGVDLTSMMRDLQQDQAIKEQIEQLTGKRAESIGSSGEEGFDNGNFDDVSEDSGDTGGDTEDFGSEEAKLIAFKKNLSGTRPYQVKRSSNLLTREFGDVPQVGRINKSGSGMHAYVNEHQQARKVNSLIMKAMDSLKDPERRAQVRKNVNARLRVKDPTGR